MGRDGAVIPCLQAFPGGAVARHTDLQPVEAARNRCVDRSKSMSGDDVERSGGEITTEAEQAARLQQDADEMTRALREALERRKQRAAAGLQDVRRTKGWAVRALLPRIEILREATRLATPIREQQVMLSEVGIIVSYNSLRRFLMDYLPDEYMKYLANVRTTRQRPSAGQKSDVVEVEQQKVESVRKPVISERHAPVIDDPAALRRVRDEDVDLEDYDM
ncbi:hypothetical protein SAMN05216221_0618 [Pseudomonas oryzae]|uniref:Uncharacterized protein n=2 Tax=Pseudomonas oryzae TaxID=1392877 RepID=A0A1H1MU54_9PSED|nr:hypothetical protein SAMN05216221_0618 [Pseudomonas oryzae]